MWLPDPLWLEKVRTAAQRGEIRTVTGVGPAPCMIGTAELPLYFPRTRRRWRRRPRYPALERDLMVFAADLDPPCPLVHGGYIPAGLLAVGRAHINLAIDDQGPHQGRVP